MLAILKTSGIWTNLCKYLHHFGLVRRTYLEELPPPLFGIDQEESLLLCRPLPLQCLLSEIHTVTSAVKYRALMLLLQRRLYIDSDRFLTASMEFCCNDSLLVHRLRYFVHE